jgi:hypothetical protein
VFFSASEEARSDLLIKVILRKPNRQITRRIGVVTPSRRKRFRTKE